METKRNEEENLTMERLEEENTSLMDDETEILSNDEEETSSIAEEETNVLENDALISESVVSDDKELKKKRIQEEVWEETNPLVRKMDFMEHAVRVVRVASRRLFSHGQYILAGYYAIGPLAYLTTAAAIGTAATLSTLYTTSYQVEIDGVSMGVVASQDVVKRALSEVHEQGSQIFGQDFQLDYDISYDFGLNLKVALSDSSNIEHYLYTQLEELGEAMGRYGVMLNGVMLGIVETEADLQFVLNGILSDYCNENTISAEFVEEIVTERVYEGENIPLEELAVKLTKNTTGETTYTVQSGDTFNGIAYKNDMTMSELASLNSDVDPDRLYVGNVLTVKETIPLLSVTTVEHVSYVDVIPCPVEEVDDPSSYVGLSKIVQTGVEGSADVVANVTYVNGREVARDVLESVILQEPTVTIRAVGTAERPKTASYGSFIWPCSGTISSYFGARTLYGVYNYHSGLDIAAPYGTPVYAADGGTVSFSGWRSSYGNIVIITHDNGSQTYYAHNSSLLVSSGQKVYRGQQIAKVGSTGNSTGNHLHFEVRIGGQAVNPLGYLP